LLHPLHHLRVRAPQPARPRISPTPVSGHGPGAGVVDVPTAAGRFGLGPAVGVPVRRLVGLVFPPGVRTDLGFSERRRDQSGELLWVAGDTGPARGMRVRETQDPGAELIDLDSDRADLAGGLGGAGEATTFYLGGPGQRGQSITTSPDRINPSHK
jgi:hypothetical protein